jgi:flagellar biosynthetic protein FliR
MFTVSGAALQAWIATFFYPFFRILALCGSAPLLGHKGVPQRVRIGLALLLTVLILPTLDPVPAVTPLSAAGVLLLLQQLIIGFALGFTLQLVFAAVELAGEVIGLQMGLSFASFIDPTNSGQQSPVTGSFMTLLMMLVFLSVNGHLLLLAGLADSFHTLPPYHAALPALDFHAIAAAAGRLFADGLQLALPLVGTMLLVNLALGVLTRTAPQLNLFAVGFPITLIVGLLVMWLALPWMLPAMEAAIQATFDYWLRVV